MLDHLKKRMEEIAKRAEEVVKLPEEQREARYDICKSCEHFIKSTTTCKKCGCFMAAKTYLPFASCPIEKWLPIKIVRTDK